MGNCDPYSDSSEPACRRAACRRQAGLGRQRYQVYSEEAADNVI